MTREEQKNVIALIVLVIFLMILAIAFCAADECKQGTASCIFCMIIVAV